MTHPTPMQAILSGPRVGLTKRQNAMLCCIRYSAKPLTYRELLPLVGLSSTGSVARLAEQLIDRGHAHRDRRGRIVANDPAPLRFIPLSQLPHPSSERKAG